MNRTPQRRVGICQVSSRWRLPADIASALEADGDAAQDGIFNADGTGSAPRTREERDAFLSLFGPPRFDERFDRLTRPFRGFREDDQREGGQ